MFNINKYGIILSKSKIQKIFVLICNKMKDN